MFPPLFVAEFDNIDFTPSPPMANCGPQRDTASGPWPGNILTFSPESQAPSKSIGFNLAHEVLPLFRAIDYYQILPGFLLVRAEEIWPTIKSSFAHNCPPATLLYPCLPVTGLITNVFGQ